MGQARITWEDLPLFANDMMLGAAVVGPQGASHWAKVTVKNLERVPGFPKYDEAHGGRYTPAVRKFYEVQHETQAQRTSVSGMPGTGRWTDQRLKRQA